MDPGITGSAAVHERDVFAELCMCVSTVMRVFCQQGLDAFAEQCVGLSAVITGVL